VAPGRWLIIGSDVSGRSRAQRGRPDSDASVNFGPFPSGTKIKLVQAPGGKPNIKPGAGDIDYKVTLRGDAKIVGIDNFNNVSAPALCLVPPAPK
jgi:hypothetical protein